jgi:hypothetical protein
VDILSMAICGRSPYIYTQALLEPKIVCSHRNKGAFSVGFRFSIL